MTTRVAKELDAQTPGASWEARLPNGTSYDPVLAATFLAILEDGSPPFIGLAADRAEINRNRVYWWISCGEGPNPRDPRMTVFAQSVRRIRGKFMAKWSKKLLEAENSDKVWAQQAQWILTRLDRDMFDPPKQMVEKVSQAKDDAAKAPSPASAEESDKAQDSLGTIQ